MNPGNHKSAIEEKRALLTRVRVVVEHYEQHSTAGAKIMRGVRYDLAVRATDINGDACLFPACTCARADCAARPSCPPPDLPHWIGRAEG